MSDWFVPSSSPPTPSSGREPTLPTCSQPSLDPGHLELDAKFPTRWIRAETWRVILGLLASALASPSGLMA